jgi:hypothetical protein
VSVIGSSYRLVGALFLALAIIYLGFFVDRTDSENLIVAFVLAFAGYLSLVYRPKQSWLKPLVGLGIMLRLALVFTFPLLSDDVYRFLWDGHLIAAGYNPFAELPAHYLEAGHAVPGLTKALFEKLNSPDYYTVYPPVAQSIFTVAVWLFPSSWHGAAVVMKLFLFACELGSLWLLWRLLGARPWLLSGVEMQDAKKVEKRKATTLQVRKTTEPQKHKTTKLLYYWLNPLIIVEITGNLHFEGAMVYFLLLAFYLLQGSRWVVAGVAMGAAVASKLLPLLLLPHLVRRLWGRSFWVFSVAIGAALLLFFVPLLLSPGFISGFRSSLALYQQKFEFNASLYYLVRAVGYQQVGWNLIATIGPFLAKLSAVGILLLALLDGRSSWRSLPAGWLMAFVLYLLCATTVHPWYLSVPIVLCVFTPWRFPLVWSFLIMLTYVSYATVPYSENLWLVGLEYLVVGGFAVWELRWRACSPKVSAVAL